MRERANEPVDGRSRNFAWAQFSALSSLLYLLSVRFHRGIIRAQIFPRAAGKYAMPNMDTYCSTLVAEGELRVTRDPNQVAS